MMLLDASKIGMGAVDCGILEDGRECAVALPWFCIAKTSRQYSAAAIYQNCLCRAKVIVSYLSTKIWNLTDCRLKQTKIWNLTDCRLKQKQQTLERPQNEQPDR